MHLRSSKSISKVDAFEDIKGFNHKASDLMRLFSSVAMVTSEVTKIR
jgi:hypothetical protein